MQKRGEISAPLPLPVGFTLLPSLLPGRQLTPCLYIELNQLPIHLVISPSHEPHLSFLSVLLALQPKALPHPLSILIQYDLGGTLNPTLDGIAPWADLWVPLGTARRIVQDIGAGNLFWGEKGRGLLGDVDDAVSWEEDGGWSHNWLPSKSHISPSSYSLDTLLSSRWPLVEVIPEQRCIHTPSGPQRQARLLSEGLYDDPSRLRRESWDSMWEGLIHWTFSAYSQYQAAPSRLSAGTESADLRSSKSPMIAVIGIIPSLLGLGTASVPTPLDFSDMSRLLPSRLDVASAGSLFVQIFNIIWELWIRVIPGTSEIRTMAFGPGAKDLQRTKLLARLNLGLCFLGWEVVIGIWHLRRKNERLRVALEEGGGSLPADVVLGGSGSSTSTPDDFTNRAQSMKFESEGDEIEVLERKRGGSPVRRNRRTRSQATTSRSKPSSSETTDGSSRKADPLLQRSDRRSDERSNTKPTDHTDRITPPGNPVNRRTLDANGPDAHVDSPKIVRLSTSKRPSLRERGKGDLDRPDVEEFANSIVNPVIFGIVAAVVYVWWPRDPPEPSVVVL